MELLICILYLAALGLLCFPVGRIFAKIQFSADHFPFRSYAFEQEGKLYEKLGIRAWQNKAPDISKLIPGIVPRKEILKRPDTKMLRIMINETCVAELIHILLPFLGLVLLWLWPGTGGLLVFLSYVLLGNLPFAIIQRYNRPRLLHLLHAARRRERINYTGQEETV